MRKTPLENPYGPFEVQRPDFSIYLLERLTKLFT
jgi:hypothetical protein